MAVVRLSRSGKQAQFIDEEGNVFVTSSNYLMGLLQGSMVKNLIILNRMPLPVGKDRYPISPLYDPTGLAQFHEKFKDAKASEDISSDLGKKRLVREKLKEDVNVW